MQAFKTVLYVIVTLVAPCLILPGYNHTGEHFTAPSRLSNMADLNTCVPQMDWSGDVAMAFKLFKQRCEMYFSIMDIKADKQVDYILLLAGEEGL